MPISVSCPDCDKSLKVKDELAGKKIRCPDCSGVVPIPAKKSKSDDDDFLDDMEPSTSKRKRRPVDDDDLLDDDDDDEPVSKRRSRKPIKKTSRRSKSGSKIWLIVGCVLGGGMLIFGLLLVVAVNQIRIAAARRAEQPVQWQNFRHPMGYAEIEMPGVAKLDSKESTNTAQTYTFTGPDYEALLLIQPFAKQWNPPVTDPAAVDKVFSIVETNLPTGSQLISKRRVLGTAYPCLEVVLRYRGKVRRQLYYVTPLAMVSPEFVTRTESDFTVERERFFNSLHGPDGKFFNGQGNAPASTDSPAIDSPPPKRTRQTTPAPKPANPGWPTE
jgi:hypothetical protein